MLTLSRRHVLKTGAGALLGMALAPLSQRSARAAEEYRLNPGPGQVNLVGAQYPQTPVWCYDGQVPGPEIRVKQGDRLRVTVENSLSQDTTVHWHGIRLPNAMDGVANLTQTAIKSGERFIYEFDLPDAGTYWYHPHINSTEQVGRGLYGALIVEEREPVQVDQDITWVLDDWRLTKNASIDERFGAMHDMSHAGRLGNTATINGQILQQYPVRAGSRVRLRLINVANARNFALRFTGHRPKIIAIDGQPVIPHEPENERIVLGAAMRVDLIIDMLGDPGASFEIIDDFYQRQPFRLTTMVYDNEAPLREKSLDTPIELPANPLTEPALDKAERLEVLFEGGAMGGMRGAMLDGGWTDIRNMAGRGLIWAINGAVSTDPFATPLFSCRKDQSYVLSLRNNTAFPHPIHLHGHAFRVVARNGQATRYREWQDTVLVMPREQVDVAFVADNPGDWMFHCHILEHQASGMTGFIRVG